MSRPVSTPARKRTLATDGVWIRKKGFKPPQPTKSPAPQSIAPSTPTTCTVTSPQDDSPASTVPGSPASVHRVSCSIDMVDLTQMRYDTKEERLERLKELGREANERETMTRMDVQSHFMKYHMPPHLMMEKHRN